MVSYTLADLKVIYQSELVTCTLNPLVPMAKKKIRQFNFELTFNGFICKENGLFHYSVPWGFMG